MLHLKPFATCGGKRYANIFGKLMLLPVAIIIQVALAATAEEGMILVLGNSEVQGITLRKRAMFIVLLIALH